MFRYTYNERSAVIPKFLYERNSYLSELDSSSQSYQSIKLEIFTFVHY